MVRVLFALAGVLGLPVLAAAQAEITGTVRDTSGAVLPGVTVEAASPALIEKVRSVVTDRNGLYRIVDLRPGSYIVRFTLAGFSAVEHEAVELSGSSISVVNADMQVGRVAETVRVTGTAPVVDVQALTRQQVLNTRVIDTLPTGRNYYSLAVLIPGVQSTATDVGGSMGEAMAQLMVHGSRLASQRITQNGVSVAGLAASGGVTAAVPNVMAASEVTIDTNAPSAELATGGIRINFIPRDGGNNLSGSVFFNFAHEDFLQADNYTDRVQRRGLGAPGSIKKNWDFASGLGGPVRRDRIWYYLTTHYTGAQNYAAGMFDNKNAWDPAKWTYEPDMSRPALSTNGEWRAAKIRVTWQADRRNKLAGEWDQQATCQCPNGVSATRSPEAADDSRFPTQRILIAEWTSTATNRLLLEAVGLHRTTGYGVVHRQPSGSLDDPAAIAAYPQMIPVIEQSSGLRYRSASDNFRNGWTENYFYRAAASYITGSHAFKAGFNNTQGHLDRRDYRLQPTLYRFNNGVPNQITLWATPFRNAATENADFGIYAQDRWTIDRLTLMGGLRFDYFKSSFPEIALGPGELVPNRNLTFPAQDNLGWKDITPRTGASYDIFGNGKTALKVTLNKYLEGQALNTDSLAGTPSPFRTLVLSTTRSWNDQNADYVPDCDLIAPEANGECGAMANRNFGGTSSGANFDPDLLRGWGNRFYNWEFSTAITREIVPRIALDIGYFRRWYGNFQVTDNVLVGPEDFSRFQITAPTDARLPGSGGYVLDGLLNVNPNKFGQVQELNTLSRKYGTQTEHWNGIDVTMNGRLDSGIFFSGGMSTGKRVTDNCEIVAKLPEMLFGAFNLRTTNTNVWLPSHWCHQEEPFLTQWKGFGSYTIPRIDVQISGTFQSFPGPLLAANFNAPNALVMPSLGRALSGGAANITVNLVEPGTMYGERVNQLDLRFGKIVRLRGTRTTVSLDVYNAFNGDTVLIQNNNFAAWQRPQTIIQARFAKITVQLDF